MLTLIILLTIGSGNAWGETVGPETISLTSGWTNKSGTTYCGGYGKTSGWYVSDYAITALSTVLSDPSNSGFSLTIEVKCLCNTALSGYSKTLSVVLLDKNNSTVGSAQTITNLATGNNSRSATWKTFTFTPTSAVTGYKIYGGKGCAVYSTKYTLSYTAGAPTPTHTLGYAVSPAASGTVDLSATTVEEGGTATATATPNSGYRFSSWAISGTGASLSSTSTNPTTVTMGTANATVTANFVSKGCSDHFGTNVISGSSADDDYGPVCAYNNYSTRQILYTKTDLDLVAGKKGTIKSIYFEYAGGDAMAARTIKIFMANTALTALSAGNCVPYASFGDPVYEGSFSCSSAGWCEITLDSPFDYNGIGNLVVLIDDNTGSWASSKNFKYHTANTTTGAQIYYNNDGSNENPATTDWSTYTATNNRPNTKFCIQEADMAPATVTLMDNGATITEVSAGAGVTLPSRTGCTGYTFAGWTKSWVTAQTTWTTTAPTIIPAGSYTPSADENLYPVYTKTEGGSGFSSYTKVTSAQSDWSGKYLISDGTLTATGSKFSSTALEVTTLTPGTTEYTSYEFTITKNGNNSNYFIITPDGTNYVGYSGSSAGLAFTTSTPASNNYLWTCSTSDPMTLNVGTNTRYIGVGTESATSVFKAYSTSGTNAKCYLYKRIEGGSTTYYISVPNCCNTLAAPANPGETPNSTGAVLTWDAVTGATGYEVNIDGGGWISTGNGTTTGYTITGKACGGTSVSWQVRATGDGSTNCAAGAATSVRNFNTTACACTSQYTYFWGTSITNDNPAASAYASHHFECFNTWNGSEGKTGLITLPNSDTENYWFVGYNGYYYNSNLPGGGRSWCTAIYDMNYANSQSDGKVLGWNSTAYPRGATGYIRIYSDNTNSNKYAAFIPSGYILRWKNNRNSDAWTSYPFTDTGASNYWETDLVQLGADLSSDKVWVGLPTSGMSESFTWCGKSEEKNLIGVGKKTGASTWAANGIVAGDANQWGKWRIEVTNNATNWNVHFVPYWKATYDVNGGGAISPTTANEGPVSCEGNATQRQVTMPAAPTYAHHDFGGWKSSADNSINAAGATVSLTQNTTFTAQWTNSQYNITATLTNVTSETSFPVAYTYTGSAANVTYSFEASSGYRLPDNVTVTGSTYSWNKNSGELTLTGTITGAVSITISGTQTHTVTWLSNGSNYVSPVTYDHGAELALPAGTPSAPGGCSGKVFVGWTSDPEISTETSTKPTIISAGGAVTGGATYRAVFADVTGDPSKFKRVTQLSDITVGGEIVFGYYVTSNTKLCGLDFSGWTTYSCATGVDETSNKIPVPSDANIWTVSKESGYWVFTNKGDGTTKMATSNAGSNNNLDPGTQTYYKWNIGASSSGTNNFYVQLYNGSSLTTCALELFSSVWKIYSPTGSTDYSSNAYTALKLYVPAGSEDNYITLCSTCTTPSDVAASGITTDGATITWNGTSQENNGGSGTGFVVKYGTNSTRDANSNTINVAAGTNTADLTGLAQGTKYYVWVRSKCDNSWSTTPAEFTTLVSHTATFIGADGSTLQSSAIVEGESVTYSGSTPVSCDTGDGASTTFVGWATDTWEDKVAKGNIPVGTTFYDIVGGGESLPNMGNGDVTYYAVFAKATGDPLTNHVWEYTFTTNKYGSSGTVLNSGVTKTLDGTESAVTVNKDWTLQAYGPLDEETWEYANVATDTKDNTKGIKIGTGSAPAQYMYFNSSAFTGTVTAVKISTSGGSMTQTTVGLTVDGTDFLNSGNATVYITNSNTEYSFTGSKTISGDEIAISWYQATTTTTALYIKKIEVDYTTGGDISYSNYMTTCSQCVTPNSVTADAITEAGATINWAGTSKTGTTGFTVLWGTDGTRANNSNSANVDADTKTYSITGLSAGTTYYVWVQSRCDGTWSDRISFTTLAVHDITFTKDNGTLSVASPVGVVDGQTLTFPNVTSTSCGTFVGWKVTEVSDYDNVAAPSPLYKYNDTKENITADESYQAVYRTATGAETNVTDNITIGVTGVTGNYADFTGATASSSAVYTGNVKKDDTRIQMRNSSNSGIVTTTSGGLAKKVTFNWAGSNTSGRIVDVYGKNTAYSSAADLYSADAAVQGTKIGSITYGTSTELTISTDYNYIGIRAKDGAAYASSIDIIWYGTPMSYMTAPTCDATVGITASFSAFTYVYGSGPSTAQSFIVSGINLSEALIVTAPTNYAVCKTADGTYTSSVSFTPAAGKVSAETVYIRLAAGLNVGTYNYDAANGVSVASNSATPQTAALNGSVTKAAGTIAFTDFNAVDHYEAELEKGMSDIDVTLTVSVTGDGSVSYSKSPAAGVSPTIPATQPTTTLHVLQPGIWTVTATLTAGTNYTGANTNCEVRVKRVDTYVDFIHNKTIKAYGSGSTVVDGKMEDWGSGYTVPYIDDNATETSGSCQQTHFKFMGWVSEDDINIVDGTFKPGYTIVTAGTEEKRSTSKTYYAIWAKLEE